MNVTLKDQVLVTLSLRNLKDLLKQVELGSEFVDGKLRLAQLIRSCAGPEDGESVFLRVVVESDDYHYGDRAPGPGYYGDEE
jgi:hypothetical protein